jgi:hypothetical protein
MLQKSRPMYAYIPGERSSRARAPILYEGKVRIEARKKEQAAVRPWSTEFGRAHRVLPVPDPQCGHLAREPGVLAGRRHRARSGRPQVARREVRGIRHAGNEDRERHRDGGGAKSAWFKDTEGNIMALIEDMSAG